MSEVTGLNENSTYSISWLANMFTYARLKRHIYPIANSTFFTHFVIVLIVLESFLIAI